MLYNSNKMISSNKFKCLVCGYESNRKYNLKVHTDNKSACEKRLKRLNNETKGQNATLMEQNATLERQNATLEGQNATLEGQNATFQSKNEFNCNLCNKKLSCLKSLNRHLKICKGVHSLQCPICKKIFSNSGSKSRHMKNVKCEVVLTEEQQRIKELEEQLKEKDKQLEEERAKPTTVINNNNNNTYNYFNPNINYNNYDNLRMDHITNEDIKRIFDNCRMKYPELSEDITRLILSIKENQCIFLPEGQKSNTCIVHKDGKEQRKPAMHVLMNMGSQVGMFIRNSNAIERRRGDISYGIFWGDNRNACGLDRIAVDEMSIVDKEIVQRNKNVVMDTCMMSENV